MENDQWIMASGIRKRKRAGRFEVNAGPLLDLMIAREGAVRGRSARQVVGNRMNIFVKRVALDKRMSAAPLKVRPTLSSV
jgi:hypothetical protein